MCKLVKPLDLAHFYRRESKHLAYQHSCRACQNARKRESQTRHNAQVMSPRRRGRPPRMGNVCGECCGLPHRVVGPRCWACQLDYAPEPPLDIRDFLYRAPDREIV